MGKISLINPITVILIDILIIAKGTRFGKNNLDVFRGIFFEVLMFEMKSSCPY